MLAAVAVTIAEETSTIPKMNSVNSRSMPKPLSLNRDFDDWRWVSPLLRKVRVSWMLEKTSVVTVVLLEILCVMGDRGFERPEVVPEPKGFELLEFGKWDEVMSSVSADLGRLWGVGHERRRAERSSRDLIVDFFLCAAIRGRSPFQSVQRTL
jgi:hypothetical protein